MPRALSRLLVAGSVLPLVLTAAVVPASAATAPRPALDAASLTATQLTPDETLTGTKSPSSRLAQTDPALLARTDTAPVDVVVKLDVDSAAAYTGGVDGLAATSPGVTGEALTGQSPAEEAYEAYQAESEADVVARLQAVVPDLEVGQSLRTVYGGFAARVPADRVEDVLAVDGVAAVQSDDLRQLLTDASSDFIGATPVQQQLGGAPDAGRGLIYGNLDSGVWPEHPSFADLGTLGAPPGPARECDYGDNPLTPEVDVFACNDKLIGGAAFLDTYLSVPGLADEEPFTSARDSNGHGTHTASTSAGNVVDDVEVLGSRLGPVRGVAPGAWVMEYKVCGVRGCFATDSAAAVQQAILDGVDVINFSISGGTDPWTDPVELAFLDAYAAGVFVAASAGNSGPGASTANHLAPWVTTVGASTQTRTFESTLTLTAGGDTFTATGASVTAGVGPAPVVMADAADPFCIQPAAPGAYAGQVVACARGSNARVDKGYNVLQGGAAGMVLYNPTLADAATDTHWLPAVHLPDGAAFVAFMRSHQGVTGSFTAGAAAQGRGDVMAAFSSRGPAGQFVKPDVTAPGVQVLAGDTPVTETVSSGPPGEYYQAISGTSMSGPHVAGAALLIRAVHPTWTPGQVRSALMTTALTEVLKEDLVRPADPFDMGSGSIRVDRARSAILTLDESAAGFLAAGASPAAAVHLNLPSVNAPVMPGRLTTTRTFTNTSDRAMGVRVTSRAPAGSTIEVSPRAASVRAGGTLTVTITISSAEATGAQQFGSVTVTPVSRGPVMHLPVAWVPTQGEVALAQTCAPETLPRTRTARTTCTVTASNLGGTGTVVDLRSTVSNRLRVTGAQGAAVTQGGVRLDGVTLDAGGPGVPSLTAGSTPAGGYLPLGDFGLRPTAVGDEEIVNLTTPTFTWNGTVYDRVGVTSNGYLVAGGGTLADVRFDPPSGPSAAPPNDVIAPLWTDLDGTGAAGVTVGVLGNGSLRWLVVDWTLNVFGTTDTRSFQAWIGLQGVQDVSFDYSAPATAPGSQPFAVGAENSLGQGQMSAVLPTGGAVVTSSDPRSGATASYSYQVAGVVVGDGVATTTMTASTMAGQTVVRSRVRVV